MIRVFKIIGAAVGRPEDRRGQGYAIGCGPAEDLSGLASAGRQDGDLRTHGIERDGVLVKLWKVNLSGSAPKVVELDGAGLRPGQDGDVVIPMATGSPSRAAS